MKKILIHSESFRSSEKLINILEEKISNVKITVSENLEKSENRVLNSKFDMMILNLTNFTKKHSQFIRDIRFWGNNTSLLVISHNVNPTFYSSYDLNGKPYFLEADFEEKKLVGISKKLLRSKQIPQQLHQRYHTNEESLLEILKSGKIVNSNLYNLSKGGAYMEFQGDDSNKMTVGEVVKISVTLGQMEKSHDLNAKVIWTTHKGRYSGRSGIGLKFIKHQELYRHLLGSV